MSLDEAYVAQLGPTRSGVLVVRSELLRAPADFRSPKYSEGCSDQGIKCAPPTSNDAKYLPARMYIFFGNPFFVAR
jgi:hypothetical protein